MNKLKSDPICKICGVGVVSEASELVEYTYRGKSTMLPLHYLNCSACGESVGLRDSRRNVKLVLKFQKEVDSI